MKLALARSTGSALLSCRGLSAGSRWGEKAASFVHLLACVGPPFPRVLLRLLRLLLTTRRACPLRLVHTALVSATPGWSTPFWAPAHAACPSANHACKRSCGGNSHKAEKGCEQNSKNLRCMLTWMHNLKTAERPISRSVTTQICFCNNCGLHNACT